MTNDQTRKYIYIALLCAQGIIIGLVERAIPFPFAVAPGAKLGLANLITIISLFTLPVSDCFLLMVMRTVLSALLGGTLSTFMYSIAGATLSFFGMVLLKQFSRRFMSMIGISAAGGLLFNVGQLCVASFIGQSWQVLLYLPVLAFLGILAGIAVGVAANFLFEHVKTLTFFKAQHEI
ncbi:Gx transporter family protein [Latilactobacillus curvatus]|uniref:Heptaprenyl diphosphate synthase subunit I n=1 Tax=Latilactobacillus curvatus TaxID=28038 RepID=A0ABN6GJ56_LATCU|nr:Gx transporter family protein [Latilactobacillus curvatus]QEA48756.1 Gx transporter family protein [Latilactobacillus curvatus]WBY49131.1 Gx transporter family protein [Latilactobacillus curvatus]WIE01059.1 Gx transporter family protein [Latilactobacillus curvatus]BCX30883.1 heptaprenyl diphosphate synthase subunit I [Latilactobacillus curvatus]